MSAAAPIALNFQASRVQAAAARQEGRDIQAANEFNAEIARQQALEEERKAVRQSQIQRQATRNIAAGNKATIAKSGVTVEGSPLLALQKNAENAALDNFLILREGRINRQRALSQAKLDIFKGRIARSAGSAKSKAILLAAKAKVITDVQSSIQSAASAGGG